MVNVVSLVRFVWLLVVLFLVYIFINIICFRCSWWYFILEMLVSLVDNLVIWCSVDLFLSVSLLRFGVKFERFVWGGFGYVIVSI